MGSRKRLRRPQHYYIKVPNKRNIRSPHYRKWRQAVLSRDGKRCQVCNTPRNLQAHHIKKWANYPYLRYEVSNGITLCRKCHDKIKNKEERYVVMFNKMVELTLIRIMKEKLNESKEKPGT